MQVRAISENLLDIRDGIDAIDVELARLLSRRLELVVSAVEHKRDLVKDDDLTRVNAILERVRSHATRFGADPTSLDVIYRVIIAQGIKLQHDLGGVAGTDCSCDLADEVMSPHCLAYVMSTMRAMRRLDERPVPEDLLEKLVQAASWAPVGANRQTYRFVIVTDKEQLARLAPHWANAMSFYLGALCPPRTLDAQGQFDRVRAAMTFQCENFARIPALIVVCYEPSSFWNRAMRKPRNTIRQLRSLPLSRWLPVLRNLNRWAGRASAASVYPAVENLLLTARAHGLGATLTTWHSAFESDFKSVLRVPRAFDIYAVIPVGYPLGRFGPVRRRPVGELIDHELWAGNKR